MTTDWYLDSSVGVRILTGHSRDAVQWLAEARARGEAVTSSTLHRLEVSRVALREGLDQRRVLTYLAALDLRVASEAQLVRAERIPHYLKTLDTIHLQCALDLRAEGRDITVVTHDRAMAEVASLLGFRVYDPVED